MHWQSAVELSPQGTAIRRTKTGGILLRFSDGITYRVLGAKIWQRPEAIWDETNDWPDWFPLGNKDVTFRLIESSILDIQ